MTTAATQLLWDNFRRTILVAKEERVHCLLGKPLIEVFADGNRGHIGIWLEVPDGVEIPADLALLSFIRTARRSRRGVPVLELTVSDEALYRAFYYLGIAVTERVSRDNTPVANALVAEVQCFAELVRLRSTLGGEREVGLVGELLCLEHVLVSRGSSALSEWTGPLREPHDFRIGNREYEVKTTTKPRRVHVIHGVEQLVPSEGCSLFVLSVLLGPPGEVKVSLLGQVQRIRGLLSTAPAQAARFAGLLTECGYSEADQAQYSTMYSLRRPIAVVPVGPQFPVIARPMIQEVFGSRAVRIEALTYDVNMEGLEDAEASALWQGSLT